MRDNSIECCLICVLAALLGSCCSKSAALPKTVPVSGTVTLDGKPIPGAELICTPVKSTRGTGASGRTDQDGKYELHDRSGAKGAPAGEYRVSILKAGLAGIPKKTGDVPDPTLASLIGVQNVTVPEGGGTLDFPLKSRSK
jgi:hypothetical protein